MKGRDQADAVVVLLLLLLLLRPKEVVTATITPFPPGAATE